MNFKIQKQIKLSLLSLVLVTFLGCSHNPKVVFPTKAYQDIIWSESEKKKNIALKHLARNEYSSSHLIRIKDREVPHYHDTHNLTVVMISGKSIIHFKEHEVVLEKGDVVTVPKGTYHWAENIDGEASVVFATFSPAFKGKDKRLAE
jgi:mannose-6-phosphate isomerase-like protein (cupin superfamily)